MANTRGRTGSYFFCLVCGERFYRGPAQIRNGSTKTCSKKCHGEYYSGEKNPFWGKTHSEETRAKMAAAKTGRPSPKKGIPGKIPGAETRRKLSESMKKRWTEHRETMLANMSRGPRHPYYKHPELRRHRKQFTQRQRREWKAQKCFYCGSIQNLVLDHIVPIFDGGDNVPENAQTLCRKCNIWKIYYVDLPRYHASLALQGGRIN